MKFTHRIEFSVCLPSNFSNMKYSFCCALINWVNKEFMNKFTALIVVAK